MEKVEKLLDESIASEGYLIKDQPSSKLINLNEIDFDVLRKKFNQGRKRTELEKLKAILESKLKQMILLNKTRMDYLETYQKMIAEYNAGSMNVEDLFNELVELVKKLRQVRKTCPTSSLGGRNGLLPSICFFTISQRITLFYVDITIYEDFRILSDSSKS